MPNFKDIEPYSDKQVSATIKRMLSDKEAIAGISAYLLPCLAKVFPSITAYLVHKYLCFKLSGITSVKEFQDLLAPYVKQLINKTTDQFQIKGIDNLHSDKQYLFLSNHRDIATDGMLTNYAVFTNNIVTPHFAIGDNLTHNQTVADLMRVNKCFLVKRSLTGLKGKFLALQQLSAYIHHCVVGRHASVWMAHREGRAKDGIDKTDIAVLKMLHVHQCKQSSFAQAMNALNIVPISISYEYDPVIVEKAKELLELEKSGVYEKSEGEDQRSTINGLMGFKGKVAIAFCNVVVCSEGDEQQDFAAKIDEEIAREQVIYPTQKMASVLLTDGSDSIAYKELVEQYPVHAQYFKDYSAQLESDVYSKVLEIYANIYKQAHNKGI